MRQRLSLIPIIALAAALLLPAGAARAEDAARPPAEALKGIKDFLGLSVYVQGGYAHDLTHDLIDDKDIPRRVFDTKDDSFTLDLAEFNLYKGAPSSGGIGYGFKLAVGQTAKIVNLTENGSGEFGLSGPGDAIDLFEGYLEALAPLGRGLKFTLGKFVTMHGAEVIEAEPNLNYSRSFLFGFAIPFTHTGLKVSYPVADWLSAGFHVVNGWDVVEDNNDAKSLGYTICLTPTPDYGLTVNFMRGPEQTDNNSNIRYLADVVGTARPLPGLTLVVNYDYGFEDQASVVEPGRNARWWGVAGYAAYQLTDMLSGAVRVETFNDPTGARGIGGRVYEVTLTPQITYCGLKIRPEYRHDWSPADVFNGQGSQDTVALGAMYTW